MEVMGEFGRLYEQQYAVALFNKVRFDVEGGGGPQPQLLRRKVKCQNPHSVFSLKVLTPSQRFPNNVNTQQNTTIYDLFTHKFKCNLIYYHSNATAQNSDFLSFLGRFGLPY